MDVIAIVPVDWFIPADLDKDPADMPQYRSCDFCHETACEDIWAGKKEPDFRPFYQQRGGVGDGLNVCGNCLDAYLSERPG